VYRAIGDVDRALEGVDPADAAKVLKTIETFAVECSINKVATSEALAYVVDEAVQVFGGNGYSREFPVERAYRDARITRIYEGTNEINRLIIPTRLLKNAAALSEPIAASGAGSALADVHDLLGRGKRLATAALTTIAQAYGAAAKDEQEVLAHAANIVIEVYAIESGLARAEKMAKGEGTRNGIAADCVRVYANDAADRMAHAGKQIVNAMASQAGKTDALTAALAPIATHAGTDTVAARRRIGDAAISAGRYPF
jgi:butyryl-CoA dehydrogenase